MYEVWTTTCVTERRLRTFENKIWRMTRGPVRDTRGQTDGEGSSIKNCNKKWTQLPGTREAKEYSGWDM